MYLLDNYKKNVSNETIKKINDLNNYEDLVKNSTIDSDYGILNYFNKIENYLKFSVNVANTETTLTNLKNLFLGEPLNLNENDEDFKKMFETIEKDFKRLGYKNSLYNWNKNLNFMEFYKTKFLEMLSTNKELSSYDIVGKTTKSFSKLFYGTKVINKEDMDKFLFNIELKNNNKTEIEINKNDFVEDVKNLCKELDVEFVDKIDINIKNLSNKINLINEDLIQNKNSLLIREEKIKSNKKLKSEIIKSIDSILSEDDKKNLIKKNIDYDFKNFDNMKNITVLNIMDMFNNLDKYITNENESLLDSVKNKISSFTLKNKIEKIQIEAKNIFSSISKEYNEKILPLYLKPKSLLDDKFNFKITYEENSFYNDFDPYKEILEKFQKINSIFTQSKSLEYNRYILDKLIYTASNQNNYNNYFDSLRNDKNEFKYYLQEILKNIKDEKEYSIKEIKQFLYLTLSNNKTIYDLHKNTNFLENINENKFIKNLLDNKFDFNVKDFDIKRLKYINDILIYNKDIEKLFQSEISIDIKDIFYKKLNLSTNSEEGEIQLNKLLEIFNTKLNELNFKQSNTLLLMILESYDDGKFNEKKFNEFMDIFKKPLNKITNEDKVLINSVEDNWLKWSILVGREVQDKNLVNSSINPIEFEFNKMNTLKKVISDIKPIDSISKYDYNFLQLMIKHIPNFEENTKDFSKDFFGKYNNYMNQEKYKKYIYMFNRCLENIIKEDNYLINNKLTKIFENGNIDFNALVNEVKLLSKFVNIIKEPKFESFNISYNQLYTILNGKSNLINTIINIKDQELFEQLITNIDSLPKITDKKLLQYIEYYNKMSKSNTFINFNIEDCKIPLIEKQFDNGYSYKIKTIKDFDILLTGEKTDCCMTIGNAGWNIYKHMYQYPKENTIFEVYKNGKPVANSWTWINENQVCFDNIEVLGGELRDNVIDCYRDAALRMISETNHIEIVNFGTPHTDIDVNLLGNKIIDNNFRPFNYLNVYTDSRKQMCIATTNPFLTNVNEMLSKLEKTKLNETQLDCLKETISNNLLDNSLNIKLNNGNELSSSQGILFNFNNDDDDEIDF